MKTAGRFVIAEGLRIKAKTLDSRQKHAGMTGERINQRFLNRIFQTEALPKAEEILLRNL
jgi:hypothetical protein